MTPEYRPPPVWTYDRALDAVLIRLADDVWRREETARRSREARAHRD